MALVLLDGCEDGSSIVGAGIVAGRYQNCLRTTNGTTYYNLLPAHESDTLTLGMAIRINANGNSNIEMRWNSDAGATNHLRWSINTNGSIQANRGVSTLATSAAGLIVLGVWNYLEFQSRLHDTLGTMIVRLNGATVLSFGPGDTKNAGTKTTFDQITFLTGLSSSETLMDDVYLKSGTGDTSFLGNITVETVLPTAGGAVSQWTGSDGDTVDNYQMVNESQVSTADDYVYASTVGQQELFAMADLVHTTGTIVGVCHTAWMLRTDAVTTRNVQLLNRGAAITKSPAHALGTAHRGYDYTLAADPEGATEQGIVVTNAPNTQFSAANQIAGCRVQMNAAGFVTKIRYQRRSSDAATLLFKLWDGAGVKVSEIADTQTTTGTFTVALPVPIAVAASGYVTATVSLAAGIPGNSSNGYPVTNSANCTFIEYRYGPNVDTYPASTTVGSSFYVEPIFTLALIPWTIANVNALQGGVELA